MARRARREALTTTEVCLEVRIPSFKRGVLGRYPQLQTGARVEIRAGRGPGASLVLRAHTAADVRLALPQGVALQDWAATLELSPADAPGEVVAVAALCGAMLAAGEGDVVLPLVAADGARVLGQLSVAYNVFTPCEVAVNEDEGEGREPAEECEVDGVVSVVKVDVRMSADSVPLAVRPDARAHKVCNAYSAATACVPYHVLPSTLFAVRDNTTTDDSCSQLPFRERVERCLATHAAVPLAHVLRLLDEAPEGAAAVVLCLRGVRGEGKDGSEEGTTTVAVSPENSECSTESDSECEDEGACDCAHAGYYPSHPSRDEFVNAVLRLASRHARARIALASDDRRVAALLRRKQARLPVFLCAVRARARVGRRAKGTRPLGSPVTIVERAGCTHLAAEGAAASLRRMAAGERRPQTDEHARITRRRTWSGTAALRTADDGRCMQLACAAVAFARAAALRGVLVDGVDDQQATLLRRRNLLVVVLRGECDDGDKLECVSMKKDIFDPNSFGCTRQRSVVWAEPLVTSPAD